MKRRPTLHEVAEVAGVSIKTVSRVINDDPAVAGATAARVQEAIDRLGYRPNPFARSLRTGYDEAIGLVVESIGDPFFGEVTEAVEEATRVRGLFLIVACADTMDQERAAVQGLLHRSVCGLILVPSDLDYGAERLRIGRYGVPVVCIDRPPVGLEADTVLIENRQVARQATRHLIDRGHRRICFVTISLAPYTLRNRLDGYRDALEEAGLAFDESLVIPGSWRYGEAESSPLARILTGLAGREPPTAVFSSNARSSLLVAHTLHRTGRTDVAFVGFDDFQTAESLVPAVTVARQDPGQMGRIAAQLLFQRLDGDDAPAKRVVLPTQLIERGSGELAPPADRPDPLGRRARPGDGAERTARMAPTSPTARTVLGERPEQPVGRGTR